MNSPCRCYCHKGLSCVSVIYKIGEGMFVIYIIGVGMFVIYNIDVDMFVIYNIELIENGIDL